jgi:competence protein ComEA
MKSEKTDLLAETMKLLAKNAYTVRYVPHEVIEDYNATYNVVFENKHVTTGASERLKIPLNEIWISEMWKPYETYIIFHELREIYHRAKGLSRDEAHEKAVEEGSSLWRDESLWQKMIRDVQEMDRKTVEKKKRKPD